MKLSKVAFHPVDRSLIPEDLKSLPRAQKRLMEVVVKGTAAAPDSLPRSWSLDSCLAPKHFLGSTDDATRVASTEFDVTELESPFDPLSKVKQTGQTTMLPSDIVFRSVGYKSAALEGFAEAGIQFDERRGVVSNDGMGRIVRLLADSQDDVTAQQVPGMYCAGWVKRGPTGVIASTMNDAFATGDAIAQDWLSGKQFLRSGETSSAGGWDAITNEVGPQTARKAVSWDQWHKIDKAEKAKGKTSGKEREKCTSTADMLSVVD